jgi:hypothetical protein
LFSDRNELRSCPHIARAVVATPSRERRCLWDPGAMLPANCPDRQRGSSASVRLYCVRVRTEEPLYLSRNISLRLPPLLGTNGYFRGSLSSCPSPPMDSARDRTCSLTRCDPFRASRSPRATPISFVRNVSVAVAAHAQRVPCIVPRVQVEGRPHDHLLSPFPPVGAFSFGGIDCHRKRQSLTHHTPRTSPVSIWTAG